MTKDVSFGNLLKYVMVWVVVTPKSLFYEVKSCLYIVFGVTTYAETAQLAVHRRMSPCGALRVKGDSPTKSAPRVLAR